jgi:hypothetical protein
MLIRPPVTAPSRADCTLILPLLVGSLGKASAAGGALFVSTVAVDVILDPVGIRPGGSQPASWGEERRVPGPVDIVEHRARLAA